LQQFEIDVENLGQAKKEKYRKQIEAKRKALEIEAAQGQPVPGPPPLTPQYWMGIIHPTAWQPNFIPVAGAQQYQNPLAHHFQPHQQPLLLPSPQIFPQTQYLEQGQQSQPPQFPPDQQWPWQ
jgi:hypothetical protein